MRVRNRTEGTSHSHNVCRHNFAVTVCPRNRGSHKPGARGVFVCPHNFVTVCLRNVCPAVVSRGRGVPNLC